MSGYAFGETVQRDRRRPIASPYNPDREAVPGWGDVTLADVDTIDLEGVYVAAPSATALADPARSAQIISMSLYSTDRNVDVAVGDRIRWGGEAYYVSVRPMGDVNPFTGWSPGVEIPLDGEEG